MSEYEGRFFEGLQALSDSAFPKTCSKCGRRYDSPDDFFRQSNAPSGSQTGLRKAEDDDETPIVELFRNCECGSTLMDFFSDRRDTSERGLRRRRLFGELLEVLEEQGMPRAEARVELLKVMNGDSSPKLESMGVRISARSYVEDGESPDEDDSPAPEAERR